MLYQIRMTYLNFKTHEEYLREIELAQMDRQTSTSINWMHKHFMHYLKLKSDESSILGMVEGREQ